MKLADQIARHNDSITLQELQDGNNKLVFECAECGARRSLDLAALIETHGGGTRVAYVKRIARCAQCD